MEDKDIEDDEALKGILKSLDKVFSMVFVLEMVLKVTAYGPKKYLGDAWCWLDFIIVAVQYCMQLQGGPKSDVRLVFEFSFSLDALGLYL